ncbi:hypothetical protein cypCar_00036717 [Cyprinus carpio]|nr:hypothetical protein cypCar_00036717 [Cyprinus carpio]
MLRRIVLITLLISSGKISTDQLLFVLFTWKCTKKSPLEMNLKKALMTLKRSWGNVCDEIGFLKSIMYRQVSEPEYMDTLVEELSTTR